MYASVSGVRRGCTPVASNTAARTAGCGSAFARTTAPSEPTTPRRGSIVWEYDSNREFATANEVPAKAASMTSPGCCTPAWCVLRRWGRRSSRLGR